jgi:hypothetical protein
MKRESKELAGGYKTVSLKLSPEIAQKITEKSTGNESKLVEETVFPLLKTVKKLEPRKYKAEPLARKTLVFTNRFMNEIQKKNIKSVGVLVESILRKAWL